LGLKPGNKGTHGEFQTPTLAPLVIEMQTPFLTTSLFFNNPYQSQEDEVAGETSKKETPFFKYLPRSASTQRRG
jgi:hypothetical protein